MEIMKPKLHYHNEDLIAGVSNRLQSRVKGQGVQRCSVENVPLEEERVKKVFFCLFGFGF